MIKREQIFMIDIFYNPVPLYFSFPDWLLERKSSSVIMHNMSQQ